ncbi:MAG TPA: hypothetical protein PKW15_08650, partial [Alphaproteobacteria bacterium]|nr:hypothetical protein [Alphaproteobacteria bacterium]
DQFAKSQNIMDVGFEIGTDETVGEDFTPAEWDQFLAEVMGAAIAAGANLPISFAVPMGTKVKEMCNAGGLSSRSADMRKWEARIAELHTIAACHHVILKLHNSDYMARDMIDHYIEHGVRCMNVAPEFGVVESRTLLGLMAQYGMGDLLSAFHAVALASGRWRRWLMDDSTATEAEKAMMAGHYVFSEPAIEMIRSRAAQQLLTHGVSLEAELQGAIERAIEHYLLPLIGAQEADVRNQRTA